MADQMNDYRRAANALDLVDWCAEQVTDPLLLAKFVERTRQTLETLEARMGGQV